MEYYLKCIIPTYEEWNAYQLRENNIDDFISFIKPYAHSIDIYRKNDKLIKINFKWNPYEHDYSDFVSIFPYQYFAYEEDSKDNYKIFKTEDIGPEWYVYKELRLYEGKN